jgi:O-antigen ligase
METNIGAIRKNTMFDGTTIITFADTALLIGFLSLATLALTEKKFYVWKFLSLLGFFAGLIVSVTYQARGGWVTIPFMLVILGFLYMKTCRESLSTKKIFALCSVGILFCAVFLALPTVQHRIHMAQSDIENYSDNVNKDTSIGYRFQLYQTGLHIASNHFLLGVEQYKKTCLGAVPEVAAYVKTGAVSPWVLTTPHFHNDLLQQLVYRGAIGLLSMFLIYLLPFLLYLKHTKSTDKNYCFAFMGLLFTVSFFIAGQTEPFFRHQGFMNFYTIFTAFFLAAVLPKKVK